jgi:hypothetical protein
MIEEFLRKYKKVSSVSELKNRLSKKVMHQTLKLVLRYLWESKKIDYTPEEIVWVFRER